MAIAVRLLAAVAIVVVVEQHRQGNGGHEGAGEGDVRMRRAWAATVFPVVISRHGSLYPIVPPAAIADSLRR